MDIALLCLHLAAYLGLGLALGLPAMRRPAAGLLALAAVASLAAGLFGPAERTLTTVHTYAGYQGIDQEVSMVSFPTGTFTAPGWQWPVPFAAFAGLWLLVLLRRPAAATARPWLLPVAAGWTATAAWLGMQWLAAPAAVVQPLGLDRFLFPAGLGLTFALARTAQSLAGLFLGLSCGTLFLRLPAAGFSKYASDHQLGTCLDVTKVVDIVNPITQTHFEERLVPGSPEQQFWLIWMEHVFVFPPLHLLSLFGIAFGAYMFHRHGGDPSAPANR